MLLASVLISLTAGSLAVITTETLTIAPSSTDKSSTLTKSLSPVKAAESSSNYKYIRIREALSTTRNSVSTFPATSNKYSRMSQNVLDENPSEHLWSSNSTTPKGITSNVKVMRSNNHTNIRSFNNLDSSGVSQFNVSKIADPVDGMKIALPLHYSQPQEFLKHHQLKVETTMDVKHKLRHEHFNFYLDRMMKSSGRRAGDSGETRKEVSQDMKGYKSGKLMVADPTKVKRLRKDPERIVGLTTPSKYEIKRYRKPRKRNKNLQNGAEISVSDLYRRLIRETLSNVAKSTLEERAEHSKISEIQKKKIIDKFLKFVKGNRALVENYVASRQTRQSGRRRLGRAFAFDRDLRNSTLAKLSLDLSPAKDKQIEEMRLKNRICQRNVLVPEGPKYGAMGNIRRPAYTPKQGRPDFPVTEEATFLIPACCNCCKKSLLGCA